MVCIVSGYLFTLYLLHCKWYVIKCSFLGNVNHNNQICCRKEESTISIDNYKCTAQNEANSKSPAIFVINIQYKIMLQSIFFINKHHKYF